MKENKDIIEETISDAEPISDTTTSPIIDNDEDSMDVYCVNDPSSYYPATYVIYGMAAGLVAGILGMTLFNNNKLILCVCVFLGTLIGYFIKKGDPHEK